MFLRLHILLQGFYKTIKETILILLQYKESCSNSMKNDTIHQNYLLYNKLLPFHFTIKLVNVTVACIFTTSTACFIIDATAIW